MAGLEQRHPGPRRGRSSDLGFRLFLAGGGRTSARPPHPPVRHPLLHLLRPMALSPDPLSLQLPLCTGAPARRRGTSERPRLGLVVASLATCGFFLAGGAVVATLSAGYGGTDLVAADQVAVAEGWCGKAKVGAAKVSEVSSILGTASTVSLEKALEVPHTLGGSMTGLDSTSGFVSSSAAKGKKIAMLAFEVANTIVKGSNLMRSLSEPSIKHLNEVVLHSEGVQHLISRDFDELLKMPAADKREELEVFTEEVVRFGNRCKDPHWHNLDCYFEKLPSERNPQSHLRGKAESVMQKLSPRFKIQLDNLCDTFAGDRLDILKQEVKVQSKHVKSSKKKSLWSKNLEEGGVTCLCTKLLYYQMLAREDIFRILITKHFRTLLKLQASFPMIFAKRWPQLLGCQE